MTIPPLILRVTHEEAISFHSGEWQNYLDFTEATWMAVVNYCYLFVNTWMCLQEPFDVSKCYIAILLTWQVDTIPFLWTKNAQQSQALLRGRIHKLCLCLEILVGFLQYLFNIISILLIFCHVAQNDHSESLTERRLLKICSRQSLLNLFGYCRLLAFYCLWSLKYCI